MSFLKIAVVDNSEYFRNMVVKTLEEKNYNVVGTAGDFKAVASILNSNIANLFIVDILMPDTCGIEVARFISDKNWDILVIMMSLLDSDDFIVESIKVGVVDYLKKPFKTKELLKSIRKAEQRIGRL